MTERPTFTIGGFSWGVASRLPRGKVVNIRQFKNALRTEARTSARQARRERLEHERRLRMANEREADGR